MIINKIVKRSGGSGYVSVPAMYIGKEIQISIEEERDMFLTKKQIIDLIETKIKEAKKGY